MNDADLLPFQQRLADLRDDRLGAIERQRSGRRDQPVQRLPVDELAGDEQPAVRLLAEVEHARERGCSARAAAASARAARARASRASAATPARPACRRRSAPVWRVARAPDLAAARAAELGFHLVARQARRGRRSAPGAAAPGGRARLLRAEVSVVGILSLTVRADFHPVGRASGTRVGSTALVGRHVTSQLRGKINSSARFPLRFLPVDLPSAGRLLPRPDGRNELLRLRDGLPAAVLPSGGPSSANSFGRAGRRVRLSFALRFLPMLTCFRVRRFQVIRVFEAMARPSITAGWPTPRLLSNPGSGARS